MGVQLIMPLMNQHGLRDSVVEASCPGPNLTLTLPQYDGKLKAKKYELPVETEQIILKACW